MQDLTGKVAIVTGASAGIGQGIARQLAKAGMTVIAVARRQDRLAALAAESSGNIIAMAADVTDESAVVAVFEATMARCGRIDLLVNNAGIAHATPPDEMSFAHWNEVIAINLNAAFLCSREAFIRMKAAGGGRIINIGSISARSPRQDSIAYTATKFALDGMTRSLALDGRAHGITASLINPGSTRSELVPGVTDKLMHDRLEPDQLGELVVYAARLPPELSLTDATVIPVNVPFLGRG